MVAMTLRFQPGLSTGGELCANINKLEARIAEQAPEIRWSFIEPDVTD